MNRRDAGPTIWPWTLTLYMTLAFDFRRQFFQIAVSNGDVNIWHIICVLSRIKISLPDF